MIWALIMGYDELAVFFWHQGGNSISSALFASVLLAKLAASPTLGRHAYFKEVREMHTHHCAASNTLKKLARCIYARS
jgi:hypothetical protein